MLQSITLFAAETQILVLLHVEPAAAELCSEVSEKLLSESSCLLLLCFTVFNRAVFRRWQRFPKLCFPPEVCVASEGQRRGRVHWHGTRLLTARHVEHKL